MPGEARRRARQVARWRRWALTVAVILALVWAAGIDEAKSVSGWATASLLAGLAYMCVGLHRARWPGPPWLSCALVFLVMAVDDYFLGFHDEVRGAMRDGLASTLGHFGSLLAAAALLIAGVAFFARWFVARLPRTTAWEASIGFAVAILGAGLIDVLGGRIAAWAGRNSEWHRLNVVLEESLEVVGVTLIFAAILELYLLAGTSGRRSVRSRRVGRRGHGRARDDAGDAHDRSTGGHDADGNARSC